MQNEFRSSWRFHLFGLFAALTSGALAIRIVWEETALTWREGPQMVGFSLAHGYAAPFLIAVPLLLVAWVLTILIRVAITIFRGRRFTGFNAVHCVVATILLITLFAPYGWWQAVFAERLARGAHAGEFLTFAAATGDLRTVNALVAHGTPLTAQSLDGQTGLGAAAVGNQVPVLAYFLQHGVAVNTLNASGDSPLDDAIGNRSTAAADYLRTHGAVRIHGSDAQHDSIVHASVTRDIEQLEKRSGPSH
jgi:hypothetical protein